ncbi:MAG: CehA/McbA family metallohydrolase [Longimicrobiales bacterium]
MRCVWLVAATSLWPASLAGQARFETTPTAELHWYKGNTHTHTTNSDGDSPPGVVARWYRDQGYDFLVLSDHNVFTDPATLAALQDTGFILIAGEELTTSFEDAAVHVNGLNIPGVIEPRTDSTLLGTVQANVDAVREVDGVPHINHPNFRWSLDTGILRAVRNDSLLEIFNGHPQVHNEGGGGRPGLEAVWDSLLSGGKRIYGIAVDDAHHFRGEFGPGRANPGRGWVMVRAPALEPAAIVSALDRGSFYASTGVVLDDVVVEPDRLTVRIREEPPDFRYTTTFVGDHGRVLAETGATPAVFVLPADARLSYVRAVVTDSGGDVAWVQPVFVRR